MTDVPGPHARIAVVEYCVPGLEAATVVTQEYIITAVGLVLYQTSGELACDLPPDEMKCE